MRWSFSEIVLTSVDFEKDFRKRHAFLGMGTRPKKPGGEEKLAEDRGQEGADPDEPQEGAADADEPEATEADAEGRRSQRDTPLPPLDKVSPRHVAYVRGLLSKFGVSPSHEYEDLVQEVLIQASRSLDSPLEPRALLFGITRHLVYRWLAKRDSERLAVQAHLDDADPELRAPDVEEVWRGAERAHAVHEAIRDLPDIFREVFVRCEIEEVPMPEVAREIGIPINTGYTRLHLARARFQDALKRYMAKKRIGKDDLAIPLALAGTLGQETLAKFAAADATPAPADPGAATSAAPSAVDLPAPPARLGWLARWHLIAANAILVTGAVSALWTAPLGPAAVPSAEPTALPEPPRATADPIVAPVKSGNEPAPPVQSSDLVVTAPPRHEEAVVRSVDARPARPPSVQSSRAEGTWARQIVGLARGGRRADAAAMAADFQRVFPRSPYRSQIESALREAAP